jgi:HEAT repeat protein
METTLDARGILLAFISHMQELMTSKLIRIVLPCSFVLTLFLAGSVRAQAQTPDAATAQNIPDLLERLKSPDREVSDQAVQSLIAIGPTVIPSVSDFIAGDNGCRSRVSAVQVIFDLDRTNDSFVPSMVQIVQTKCYASSQDDLMARRGAAFALAIVPSGIHALAELLGSKDKFIRQSAIFPFDDLTESLADLTPAVIQAIKAALPAVIAAMKDKDRTVRGVAEEVAGQILRSTNQELTVELLRLQFAKFVGPNDQVIITIDGKPVPVSPN